MNIAIVGSRGYPRLDLVRAHVGRLWALSQSRGPDITIISGTAPRFPDDLTRDERGVDEEAIRWSIHCGLSTQVLAADWDSYGKRAGPLRNSSIVHASHLIIAFWDLKSPGTRDTISKARSAHKPLIIFDPDGSRVTRVART
jgi:hypothetical protein